MTKISTLSKTNFSEIAKISGNIKFSSESDSSLTIQALKRYIMKKSLETIRLTKKVQINLDLLSLDHVSIPNFLI